MEGDLPPVRIENQTQSPPGVRNITVTDSFPFESLAIISQPKRRRKKQEEIDNNSIVAK